MSEIRNDIMQAAAPLLVIVLLIVIVAALSATGIAGTYASSQMTSSTVTLGQFITTIAVIVSIVILLAALKKI